MTSLRLARYLAYMCITTGVAFSLQLPTDATGVSSDHEGALTPSPIKVSTASGLGESVTGDVILLSSGYIPPDNGAPDSTHGSGTR